MAQVIVSGINRLSARDLTGLGLIGGLGLSLVSVSSVSVAAGSARSADNTWHIVVPAPLTVDLTTSGAGGLDTGVEAAFTFYYVYVIADSSGVNPVAGLFSLSSSSPTLPAGYDRFRRIGTVRNNISGDLFDFVQYGNSNDREVYYDDGAVNRNVLTGGAALAVTAVDLSAFVPPTSRLAYLLWRQNGTPLALYYSDPAHPGSNNFTGTLAGSDMQVWMPTSPTQQVAYLNFGGGGSIDAWLTAYKETV